MTYQIVEEVARRRAAYHAPFCRLLPMRDEYLDGANESGYLPDVDTEPRYVREEGGCPVRNISFRNCTTC